MEEQQQLDLDVPLKGIPRYRRKPTEPVEAVQLRWGQWSEVCELLGAALLDENPDGAFSTDHYTDSCGEQEPFIGLYVRTAQDTQVLVKHGEWILRDKGEGRFYPVDPEVFAATYEAV